MTFRFWLQEKWYQHCDEIRNWTGKDPGYVSAEYFQKYKWWLRSLYRKEHSG
jgi:uncharacterized protein CbrC (UPF0167 family)